MKKILLVVSIISLSTVSLAQEGDRSSAEDSETEGAIVISELSRREAREQIIRVENDIYSFYNERNGNSELDIECRQVTVTGSLIPQRVCEPLFWTKERNRQVQGLVESSGDWTGIAEMEDLGGGLTQEIEDMNRVYAELIEAYPAFAEALLILQDLKAHLEGLN